jgi:3-oxoacyl-[acyl-carrier protein] reductase
MPADRYQQLTALPPGRFFAKRLGLPESRPLRRFEPGQPALAGPALIGGDGRMGEVLTATLAAIGAELRQVAPDDDVRLGAIVFDATGIADSAGLKPLYEFFHGAIRSLGPSGRLVVLGTPPELAESRRQAVAQRALEGFVRSAAKELRGGATGTLVLVAPRAEANAESTLRFLLSAKAAYVSGQVIRIGAGESTDPSDWDQPLAGRVAVVTGASRGIGAAIARTLARDGATIVGVDVPAQGEDLTEVVNEVGGSSLLLDITDEEAPDRLAEHLEERHGGADIVVHNAGVTRDRTLARMSEDEWDMVIAINLTAQERINEMLLDGALRPGGRIVSVSSVGGIAGNRGQANYAASKAGVIGTVESLAPVLAERGQTINAVAPGFIETQMTAAMPLGAREAGRRMNSVAQGGQPVDVAEAIAWLASPASGGVNGNVVRVCGQSLIGA